ncbi:CAPN15 [Symbiodinium natans]|uniref:CAPN15 protein n=1 Tax=Symbiodinium natans TaxID=878477 RepID=A0A812I616_9DINO|nr:CAPN15 [Symbiodinium natans]
MTGQLLMKQQQYEAAKLKMEQLTRQEESYMRRADLMARRESRMEALARVHGGVLEKAFRAKAKTQQAQNKMIEGEDEVKKLNQEIKAQKQVLKTTEDQLIAIRRREEEFNNGARLAVMKSNKLECRVGVPRLHRVVFLVLDDLGTTTLNLAVKQYPRTEAAQVQEEKWDSARRMREDQEAKNLAESRLVESKQGQLGLLRQINQEDMSLAEKELEKTKRLLKDARRKNKEEAKVENEALRQEQESIKATHEAAEAKLHKVQSERERAKEEQRTAMQNVQAHVQHHVVADERERVKDAEKALKPYQLKLDEVKERLHQQQIQNQVQEQDISRDMAALQAESRQNASNLQQPGSLKCRKELDHMKVDVAERLKEDETKQANMQGPETRKAKEIDAELRREQAKVEEARQKIAAREQLDYDNKMYEMNVQKEEKAQQEVSRLQQEFHKVHNDKNEKITVMLNCTDKGDGFLRSVTARHESDVAKLREKLLALKARAKNTMTYEEVLEALQGLRNEFARHPGGVLANLVQKKTAQAEAGEAQPLQEAEGEAKDASVAHTKKRTPARKAAGRVKALEMKRLGKGLFAQKKASPQLQKLIGRSDVSYTDASKLVWRYIKQRGLSKGRIITPDHQLKKVCPEEQFDMCQLARFLKPHLKS